MPRSPKRPKKGLLSKSEDEDFERIVRQELERDSPVSPAFFNKLDRSGLHPSTRRRLLSQFLQTFHDRRELLPKELVALLRKELETGNRPQARTADPAKMKAAARLYVRGGTLRAIAEQVGLGRKHQSTIASYMRAEEFWQVCNNEAHLLAEERVLAGDWPERAASFDDVVRPILKPIIEACRRRAPEVAEMLWPRVQQKIL